MKMKRIVAILVLLPVMGCYKNNPRPDEPFFCKINGKAFRPEADTGPIGGGGGSPSTVRWDPKGWLYINAVNSSISISIFLKLPKNESVKKGVFILYNIADSSKAYYNLENTQINSKFYISESGKVTITKAENSYLSGTFEFTSKADKTGKVYKITEGCFNDL